MVIFPSPISLFDNEKDTVQSSKTIEDIFDDAVIAAKSKCTPIYRSDMDESRFVASGKSDSGSDKK